jgi:ANTAR domain-containing protein
MSNTLARYSCDQARIATPAEIPLPQLLAALDRLVGSVQPGVVFTGVARLCVPMCCDSCTISIVEDAGVAYRLCWPQADPEVSPDTAEQSPGYRLGEHELVVPFEGVGGGYQGSMAWSYRRYRPTGSDALLAQLVIERATALVRREQLEAEAASSAMLIADLEMALASSREIALAIGMVMDRHKLSTDQAFDLLSRISQHRRRRVREVAREIIETGTIRLPTGVRLLAR